MTFTQQGVVFLLAFTGFFLFGLSVGSEFMMGASTSAFLIVLGMLIHR